MSYATTIILGNLGRDPEMRYTPAGDPVTNFSVAVNKVSKDSAGNKVEYPIWYRVSTWGKTAENCNKFLHKGSKVLVEGELQGDPKTGGPRLFDRNDGSKGAAFELRATTVRFESSKSDDEAYSAGAGGAADYSGEEPGGADNSEDDIPF